MFENINTIQKLMLLFTFLIVILLAYGIFSEMKIFLKENRKITIKKILFSYGESVFQQITIILGLLSLFNFSATLSPITEGNPNIGTWSIWVLFAIFFMLSLYVAYVKRFERLSIHSIFRFLYDNKEIIIFLIISSVVRIIMFGDLRTQRWDAGEYYYSLGNACDNYDFTWKSIWNNFRLCNHSSIGFAMLYAIGEFLNFRRVKGALSINLLITVIALYMIYEMFQKYWASFNKRQALMGTMLVSISPLFLGTFGYVNVDYTLALIFIYMLYAQFKGQYILIAFWGIVLTQTKETGVFVVAGYYISHFCGWMAKRNISVNQKIKNVLKNRITWSTIVIAVFYARYIYKLRAFTAWKQNATLSSDVLWSNTGFNCFGFQIPYIIAKMKHFLVMNFAWIFVTICLVVFVCALYKKTNISMKNINGIVGGTIGFVIFSSLYVTYEIGRYNVITTITLIIIVYGISEEFLNKMNGKRCSLIIWTALSILLIGQNFFPLDIISNNVFTNVDTGAGKMLYTKETPSYFGDYLVTNYQYTWIDKAYDEMLQVAEYDENMAVILPDREIPGTHINGNCDYYHVFWDKQRNRRVMYWNDATIDINVMYLSSVLTCSLDKLPQKTVMFFIPYYGINQEEQLEIIDKQYHVIKEARTTGWGGFIEYYVLEKNN